MAITIAIIVLLAAVVLLSLGNKNPGVPNVSVESAQKMSTGSGITVLDVRTAREFAEGHLKGATHIPLDELYGRLGELLPKKNTQILVYCLAGGRSAAACRILKKNGFTRIANMQGGISAWQGKGYPLVA